MQHRLRKSLSVPMLVLAAAAAVGSTAQEVQARLTIDLPSMLTSNTIPRLGKRLTLVADYWGDSVGRIDFTETDTGQTMYVAIGDPAGGFSIFYNGQNVPDGSLMGACAIGGAGGPVGCDLAYGETLLFALEDLVDEEADPAELTIKCWSNEGGVTHRCHVTWLDGSTTCYSCVPSSSGAPVCTKSC